RAGGRGGGRGGAERAAGAGRGRAPRNPAVPAGGRRALARGGGARGQDLRPIDPRGAGGEAPRACPGGADRPRYRRLRPGAREVGVVAARVWGWTAAEGRLVRSEGALGVGLERHAAERAREAWNETRHDPSLASGCGVVIEGMAIGSNADLWRSGSADQRGVRL